MAFFDPEHLGCARVRARLAPSPATPPNAVPVTVPPDSMKNVAL